MVFDYNTLEIASCDKPINFKKDILKKIYILEDGQLYISDKDIKIIVKKYKNKTSFIFKIRSFFRHIIKNILIFPKYGTIFTDFLKIKKRYSICKQCDQFNPQNKKCKMCGCYMNIKVKLIYSECPLKKWD